MMSLNITATLDALWRPASFFERNREPVAYLDAVRQLGIILVFLGLLAGVSVLLNLGNLEQSAAASRATGNPLLANTNPYLRLFFPLLMFSGVLLVGLFRHGMVALFAQEPYTLAQTQMIAMYSMIPLVVVQACSHVVDAFFPTVPSLDGAHLSAMQTILFLLLLVAIAWDAYVTIVGIQKVYGERAIRAVVAWLAPYGASCVCCSGFLFLALFGSLGI